MRYGPTVISTADSALNQSGTVVGAEVFGPIPAIVVLTNGTSVDFKNDGSVAAATGAGTTTGAFSGNTGNAKFNVVLNEFNYDDGPKTITLTNLVAGQQYAVQLFALDDRSGTPSARQANYQDPADANDYSASFTMGNNNFLIGTFTASGTSVNLQENLPNSGGGNINALVVRRLSGQPIAPQITTEPQPANISPGGTGQFTVGANGTSLNYQWQRAAIGGSLFSNVVDVNASGVTTAQLTITNVTSANAADYRVIVSNASGSVTSSPAATLNVPSTGLTLLHRWSFSETSGTTAHDSVGGADGTLMGNASFNGGYAVLPNSGSASDSSYVSIPGGLLNSLSAVTVECWVTNNGWNNGNTFVGFGGPTAPSGTGTNFIDFFARWYNAMSSFQIQTTAGDSGLVNLGTRVNYNSIASPPSPAHYVYTYDPGAGIVTLYTNGVFSGSASGVTIPLNTLGTNLGTIGLAVWNTNFSAAIPNTSGNRPFMNAGISEVRIYSSVLTSNAIATDFQLGPDQLPLPATTTTNRPTMGAASGAGTLTLSWPTSTGSFYVQSSPVLGPNAVWSLVSGGQSLVGSNYQMTLPTTNGIPPAPPGSRNGSTASTI